MLYLIEHMKSFFLKENTMSANQVSSQGHNHEAFVDTLQCNAMYYLNENGHEISKHEFVYQLKDWHGLMLYVGSGFVKLTIAVLTLDDRRKAHIDEGSAVSAFEEWARNNGRAEEIGEDTEWQATCQADPDNAPEAEYELYFERIPYPVQGYRFEDKHGDLRIYEGDTAYWIEYVPTSDECGMGDGVDSDFYPGMLKEQYSTMMEAYFPEHVAE
jgi:hypothetical protein